MNQITRLSLRNSAAVILLCLLVLGYGLYSATQIKQQTFPDVEFPALFIQGIQAGASTEEIESGITGPIEDSIIRLKNYDSITSTSAENAASIVLQFPFGTDMDKRTSEVEGAIAKLNLPEQAKITVQRLSASAAPIYQAAVYASDGQAEEFSNKLQNEIVPKMEKLSGVSSVTLKGIPTEELQISVDKTKAAGYGITLKAIQSALAGLDYALPLGAVHEEGATIPIRLSGKIASVAQIEQLPLAPAAPAGGEHSSVPQQGAASTTSPPSDAAARGIKLAEIATVSTVTSQQEITRFNGKPSYVVEVIKNQNANTAEVANEVKELLTYEQENSGLELHVIIDQGKDIEQSVSSLVKEGLFGALFCVIIIFLFLRNIRATLISILSLPLSIFATIAVLNQMDYTLNIMTLGGIAVSIGRIVDDSIVVIENIYRWRQEKGDQMSGKELAWHATREVIGAVTSSTVATVVVFAPLAFVSGIIGEFFRPFSLAVVISIVSSLLVSVMLIPVLGAALFKRVKPHKEGARLADGFERLLRGALKRKGWVITGSVLLLAASLSIIPLLGVTFLPADSVPTASISLTLPPSSSMEQTGKISEKAEQYVESLPGLDTVLVAVGGASGNPFLGQGAKNKASLTVQFVKGTDMDAVIEQANRELPKIVAAIQNGAVVQIREGQQQGMPSGNNIDINVYSTDTKALAQAARQIEDLMKQDAELKDITNSMNELIPKWELTLKDNAEGVSPYLIMQIVGEQLRPVDGGTYTIAGKERHITIGYQQQIAAREELENLLIPTNAGLVRLKDIAELSEQKALVTVQHNEGKTYAQVKAYVKGSDTATVTKRVLKDIDSLSLPQGVEIVVGGGLKMIKEGFVQMGIAMAAAVGLVFLVLSVTFSGLLTPLLILSSLLFIPVGSLNALLLTGQALSMSAMIGMLMLVGIVVTNAVVLLDRAEKNRLAGAELREAIIEAARTRLRPILMTAFATMLALVPLALSGSSTSLISGSLAITVIGGLFTSTLLTLIVVPTLYEIAWTKRTFKRTDSI
ncbi:efflux RND transporter permease subunit [Paenibacillus sp. GCM10012307]|uniref:Efflux RND transporter permease subunit n=1 Tax=Paenibacillus roseus TaxID=2798579 RepID=A0A934J9C9_9BACL|nr:efflux RND transporter permease subunit [Paenibacillus roseus]MBJ6362683.1 efflux RND transporter permease subunit [Paenibacillus roseus]